MSRRSKKRTEREEDKKMGFFGASMESIRFFQIRLFLTLLIRLCSFLSLLFTIFPLHSWVIYFYAHGQLWLQRHHIMGVAFGYLPYVGWGFIVNEKPLVKCLLFGALVLRVITRHYWSS